MDANSIAVKMMPAQQSLGPMLRQAEWMGRPRTEPAPASPTEPVVPFAKATDRHLH
jgi:hypothetical protein